MDLSTTYLGFKLPHPLIPGASPLADQLDTVRHLEDAGAPMVVMRSLFQEQILAEELATVRATEYAAESYAEAQTYLPRPPDFVLGPDEYLEQLRRLKQAVGIPIIGSLNGTTEGGWLSYARLIQQAGADGLELNVYDLGTDLEETGTQIEERALNVVRAVKESVSIPVAVKLSPFFSSIANFAKNLDQCGVGGIVLFNRFYQPDIDIERLEVTRVNLSRPDELLLRLRWLAILSGRIHADLAATGGIHSAEDAIKAVMAGAHAVQMVSALLARGPAHLTQVRDNMALWLEQQGYESLQQMRGNMSLLRCDNPKVYERCNYMRILQGWG
jgi:dihydroorotate dehydrogenase (fumarate)